MRFAQTAQSRSNRKRIAQTRRRCLIKRRLGMESLEGRLMLSVDTPGWAFSLSSNDSTTVSVRDVKVDTANNLLVLGSFGNTVDFDPGPGTSALTPTGYTGFLAKYSSAHELIWVRMLQVGAAHTYPTSLDLDQSGNAYIGGTSFATSPEDNYLAKFDATGNSLWAHSWGSTGLDNAYAIDVDANGVLHVLGNFSGTMDLDPGPGNFIRTSSGPLDNVVYRFTNNGTFLSATVIGGPDYEYARDIAVDAAGNEYVTGAFHGTISLSGQSFTSAGDPDIYLAKLNPAGSIEWARQAARDGTTSQFLALASDGSVSLAGSFTNQVDFGPGTATLTSGGAEDVFLTRWDPNGNLLQIGQLSGPDRVRIGGLEMGPGDSPHIYGFMSGTVDLEPGPGVVNVASVGSESDFLLRVTSDYQFRDVSQVTPTGSVTVLPAFTVDARGNLYASRRYLGSVTMPTGEQFTNDVGIDSFVLKLTKAAGITVTPSVGLVTSESGGSVSLGVFLDTRPTADVTVQLASSDLTEGTVAPALLTFTPDNWHQPQTVVVTGVDDSAIDGDQSYLVILAPAASSDPNFAGLDANNVNVTNLDNDAPLVLFEDSFEVGEWNGLWVEDSQNDWYRSSQRATSGSFAAEVDGSATNATLTTTNLIDLSGMASATLTFDWLIESSFDAGEYLSLDVSTNGGASWIQDIRRLSGNVSTENVWHNETVDLTPYKSANLKVRFRSKVSAADEDANVDNVRIVGIAEGPNTPPVAVAGGPYSVNEGSSVVLSGAGSSDPDGSIASYAWDLDNDGQYDDASGISANFATTVSGAYSVGLQVTDNRGATATTTASVTVNNVAPTADAGNNLNEFVGTQIGLSAANSTDPGNDITSYAWDLDSDGQYDDATGVNAQFTPGVGVYNVGLKVTDADGAFSTDSVLITITAAPSEVVLFEDSFEVSEWNGLWVEDSQNDWFRSTQRATAGTRSAEVDGSANNATLTIAAPINVSGYTAAELTFDWLIESSFDAGEYLALDISTNGGTTWQSDVRRLNGNVSTENVWHQETVNLMPYQSTNLKFRFRSKVSDSTEDANVDNVKVVANATSGGAAMAFMATPSVDNPLGTAITNPASESIAIVPEMLTASTSIAAASTSSSSIEFQPTQQPMLKTPTSSIAEAVDSALLGMEFTQDPFAYLSI